MSVVNRPGLSLHVSTTPSLPRPASQVGENAVFITQSTATATPIPPGRGQGCSPTFGDTKQVADQPEGGPQGWWCHCEQLNPGNSTFFRSG